MEASTSQVTGQQPNAVIDDKAVRVERGGRAFHVKYFLPSSSSESTSQRSIDLPETYFSPSPTELQQAYAGQVKKREQLTDAPLLTKRLREREEAERNRAKAAKWPQTRIRVRFADRSLLESVFDSKDTIDRAYDAVRACLRDDVAGDDFVLYQTPPKKDYRPNDPNVKGKSLMQLQLTPSSLFYIRFSKPGIDNPPPLREEVLAKATELPLPPAEPAAEPAMTKAPAAKSMTGQTLGFGGASGKVVPKWFRPGGPQPKK